MLYLLYIMLVIVPSVYGKQESSQADMLQHKSVQALLIERGHLGIQEILIGHGYHQVKTCSNSVIKNEAIHRWTNRYNLRALFTPHNVALHKDGPLMQMPIDAWKKFNIIANNIRTAYKAGGALFGVAFFGISLLAPGAYNDLLAQGAVENYQQYLALSGIVLSSVTWIFSRIGKRFYSIPAEHITDLGDSVVLVRLKGLKPLFDEALHDEGEKESCQDRTTGKFIVVESS